MDIYKVYTLMKKVFTSKLLLYFGIFQVNSCRRDTQLCSYDNTEYNYVCGYTQGIFVHKVAMLM